jgi:5'-3' exonuclease
MGLKWFLTFFNNVIQKKNISDLKGKTLIVDAMHVFYTICIGLLNQCNYMVTTDGKKKLHLYALINFVKVFSSKGIKLFFVFDGKTPTEKRETIKKRGYIKRKAESELLRSTDDSCAMTDIERIKYAKRSFGLSPEDILAAKKFLDAMGIGYSQAPWEADSQIAAICMQYPDDIAGVITRDPDILMFGANKIYPHFKLGGYLDELSIDNVIDNFKSKLEEEIKILNLDITEFPIISKNDILNFFLLIGSDYGKIRSSPKHYNKEDLFRLYVIKKCNIVDTIAHLEEEGAIAAGILQNIEIAKKYYNTCEIIDPIDINLSISPPNLDILYKLILNYDFTEEFDIKYINQFIDIISSNYENFSHLKGQNLGYASFSSYSYRYKYIVNKFLNDRRKPMGVV